jgi:hypothetical protein
MKVSELIEYLQNPHCPKDAEVIVFDDSVVPNVTIKPQVVWWDTTDRKTCYLGML